MERHSRNEKNGGQFRVGSAKEDITPEDPVPMSGYGARTGYSTGVHKPLSVKSIVLSDGTSTVGIMSADLLNVSHELTTDVRRRLANTDAKIDDILLAATHTHEGPYIPAETIDITPSLTVDEDVSDTVEDIKQKCVTSLTTAYERLEPASIRVGTAENDTTPINRRAADRRGRIPTGDIDPELIVLDIETASDDEIIVFNVALHPVCLTPSDTLLSPDWPTIVYNRLAAERDGAMTIFLNGAAGDINPRARMASNRGSEQAYAYLEEIGTEVAETALEALSTAQNAPELTDPSIAVDHSELRLPVKNLGNNELLSQHLRDLDEEINRLEDEGNQEALSRLRVDRRYTNQLLHIADWNVTELPATMQYIEVGNIGILGIPGEAFVEHGIDFKSRAAVDTLLLAGYANEYVGYIPTLKELENFGYEVWTMKVAPKAIAQFRTTGLELLSAE